MAIDNPSPDYTVHAHNLFEQRVAARLIAIMSEKRRQRGKLSGSRISVSFHGKSISFSFEEHLLMETFTSADSHDPASATEL